MPVQTPLTELQPTRMRLRAAWDAHKPDFEQRRGDLQRLRVVFAQRIDVMDAAISADFGHRSMHENLISEAMIVLAEIDHALRHLRHWMRPRQVSVGWRFWPARAEVRPLPVGVVGIIAPWNYPVNLALVPLVSAIAAGNHVYLKPSEHTSQTSAWLRDLLADVFPDDRVAVALGGAEVGAAFAALPLDHLLFTGSTAIGRKVLAAAAPNLTPVTLELGGKSPAIVASDFPIDVAAARIASGKWFNAGQTCIGVDYVLVDAPRRDALVAALSAQLVARFGDLSVADDYTRIIDDAAYARLEGWIGEARARGATVLQPIPLDADHARRERLLPPTLVIDPPDDSALMREEIFGPILPVRSYRTLDEAIAHVNRHERPLALYPFSDEASTIERVLHETLSGGVSVNDTLVHFGVHALPFGGIGASGTGAIHGRSGFDTFSKLLPVFHQTRLAASDRIRPPYRGVVDRVIRFLRSKRALKMKIASWNVNSLNVRMPHLEQWLRETQPDVVALQETKLEDSRFPDTALAALGYRSVFAGQKSYNGVAILARGHALEDVQIGIPGFEDAQQRVIAATVNGVRVVNFYVVNGQAVGSEKFEYKLRWLSAARGMLARELARHPQLVVLGDFNIAPTDLDVHNPKRWHEKIMCSTLERDAFSAMADLGLHDSFRLHCSEPGHHSWWDYRLLAFDRGWGLRIDLVLVSTALRARCTAGGIDLAPRTWERPSDHAPVWVELDG